MDTFDPAVMLKLSIQRALLGNVSDRLVSVTCGLHGRHIEIWAYFSPKATDKDLKQLQYVGAEVIADFPEGYSIEEKCASADDREPEMLDFWAFIRERE